MASFSDQIKVANNDWVPYNTVDGKGLVDQIVKEAFALVGHDVVYVILPWKRAYQSVKAGETDITYPWSYTEERVAEITYNKSPLVVNRSIFWYKKGTDFSWQEYSDLAKYSIGGMIGYSDTAALEEIGIQVQSVKDELTNLKKLLAGRIDTFPMNEVVGNQVIKQNLSADEQAQLMTYEDKPLVETPMHGVFTMNERGQKLSADFEKGLQILIENGRYDEILFSGK
ncbi:substrate-binding periplasmic protein [Reinekea sp.]|jgi:polar amino acid transport system substrate-binding protein|uniref:substrate-binding periplasmic protein n=1 Tax=Reinekea sp. TaxID=1970455 RepID=UPI002A81A7BB|nr:transporter substrate-binding domain-containing protein [Reinekea sp.]